MTSRERVRTTLAHRTPDRVPVDFGSSTVTGMHVSVVAALREHYGLERRPVRLHVPSSMLGYLDEDLLDAMGVDVLGVFPRYTSFGYPNEDWKEYRLPWGQVVLVSGHFHTTTDANGDLLTNPQGDTGAPPSGRMPVGGFYFDTIPSGTSRPSPARSTSIRNSLIRATGMSQASPASARRSPSSQSRRRAPRRADGGVFAGSHGWIRPRRMAWRTSPAVSWMSSLAMIRWRWDSTVLTLIPRRAALSFAGGRKAAQQGH